MKTNQEIMAGVDAAIVYLINAKEELRQLDEDIRQITVAASRIDMVISTLRDQVTEEELDRIRERKERIERFERHFAESDGE